jgi:hypothetical protein
MNEIQTNVENFMKIIGNAEERYKFLCDEIEESNHKQQDCLHEIENSNLDVVRAYRKLTELKELRIYRRQLKEEKCLLEPVYKYVKDHKAVSIDLFKIKREIDKVSVGQEEKFYKYRAKDKHGEIMKLNDKKGE